LTQKFEQEHSRCVGVDLFVILEYLSVESCSSQAWSVQRRWQLFWRCEGQGRNRCSEERECDADRI